MMRRQQTIVKLMSDSSIIDDMLSVGNVICQSLIIKDRYAMSVKEVPVSSREIIDVAANGFGLSYRHICSFEKKFVDFLKLF